MSNAIRCPECESHNMRLLGQEFPSYQVQCAECRAVLVKFAEPAYRGHRGDTNE